MASPLIPTDKPPFARYWVLTRDGDPRGLKLYSRHYSYRRYRDGRPRRLFVGPGEKLVLITPTGDALFVWRRFYSRDQQQGVNAAVFRNESPFRSSDLIREAMQMAWQRWPGERLYSYVNPQKIKSANPGFCFLMAGWRRCGMTQRGLLILEAIPQTAPFLPPDIEYRRRARSRAVSTSPLITSLLHVPIEPS